MGKKIALALAAVLTSGTALADGLPTPEQVAIDWGYLPATDRVPTQIVEMSLQPRDAVDAELIKLGLPVPGLEPQIQGYYAVRTATPVKGDEVYELLVEWDHIWRPTVTGDFVKGQPSQSHGS